MVRLAGTPELAGKLRKHQRNESALNPGNLIQLVQDRQSVDLALTPTAAESGFPLVHVRHPLVRIAVDEIQADTLGMHRFGHVSLSAQPAEQYLALLSLLEGRGLRSFLRLEATVVDTQGHEHPELSDPLLHAFATGEVRDGVLPMPDVVEDLLCNAERAADLARLATEMELQEYNTSLVASRRASLTHSTQIKIDAAQARMDGAKDPRITRMHDGRIKNLRGHLQTKLEGLESGPVLVTSQRVAVLVVDL